jgi:hypothetical protein
MTKEERFSTITMTKKQKMPIHPPPTLRLEVGVFSAKKIKEEGLPETNGHPFFLCLIFMRLASIFIVVFWCWILLDIPFFCNFFPVMWIFIFPLAIVIPVRHRHSPPKRMVLC